MNETFHDDALDFESCEDRWFFFFFFPSQIIFFKKKKKKKRKKEKIKIWKHSWKKNSANIYTRKEDRVAVGEEQNTFTNSPGKLSSKYFFFPCGYGWEQSYPRRCTSNTGRNTVEEPQRGKPRDRNLIWEVVEEKILVETVE